MKQAQSSNLEMFHKIEFIEKELMDLKLSLLKKLTPAGKKIHSLRGIMKGIDVTDDDIETARKSLYGKVKA